MKNLLVVSMAAGLMLSTSIVSAEETLPLKAVNRAGEVIDAALEAYGGAEAITNLNSVIRKAPTKAVHPARPGMKTGSGIYPRSILKTRHLSAKTRAAAVDLILTAARSSRLMKAGR